MTEVRRLEREEDPDAEADVRRAVVVSEGGFDERGDVRSRGRVASVSDADERADRADREGVWRDGTSSTSSSMYADPSPGSRGSAPALRIA